MDAANESRVLRFFGVQESEVCRTASGLAGRYGLTQVESRSRGAETLLALTAPEAALHKAEGRLRRTFRAGLYGFALVWLALLLFLVIETAFAFGCIDRRAAWLLTPYLLWLLFAAYLNAGVWLLN